MTIALTSQLDSYVQLLTVLVIFVVVLGATLMTTKWIAGYQKKQGNTGNIELLDAARLGNNKYIQIVRIGEEYFALAVCKDTVTFLGKIPEEELRRGAAEASVKSFRDMLLMMKQGDARQAEPDAETPEDKRE